MPIPMNHHLLPQGTIAFLKKDNVMGRMTHTTRQVRKVVGLFSHHVALEKR